MGKFQSLLKQFNFRNDNTIPEKSHSSQDKT